ncbi:MAG: DNA mismatch repair endonuclease MutL [Fibrobacteres bacterium]|nr:DNA mismatch repair endonuclease MutL [Fibrobacterota bacterium]
MIRLLDELVINRIAAGEVVDRPASAVKELVENALDAGSRRIKVKLEGGGLDLISVEDDGCGMVEEDLRKCWLRHATSKMEHFEDLAQVGTYGFRGEALSSLASVAHLRIDTHHATQSDGRALVLHGGNLVSDEPSGWPRGTRVEVRGLFAGIPVRRRFLGSAQSEAQRVLGILVRQALFRPEVEFRLTHGAKDLLHVRAGERRARCRELLGALADGLEPVEWTDRSLSIQGFVGAPGTDRGRADQIYFAVNRRPIQSGTLARAVAQGMGLPPGRHPVCVLDLAIPLEQVDINVHPQKREVRFQAESAIFHAVSDAVAAALDKRSSLPLFFPASTPEVEAYEPGLGPIGIPGFQLPVEAVLPVEGLQPLPTDVNPGQTDLFATKNPNLVAFPTRAEERKVGDSGRAFAESGIPFLQVEGYLLCPLQGGLLCLDQRAAHERVLFEQALASMEREGALPAQQLLFPRPIELPVKEFQMAIAHLEALRALSFDLEAFGGQTLLLRGIPASVTQDQGEALLSEVLSAVAEEEPTRERMHRAFAAAYARSTALRRSESLSGPERSALADELFACKEPWQTPGGFPTVARIAAADLQRLFR